MRSHSLQLGRLCFIVHVPTHPSPYKHVHSCIKLTWIQALTSMVHVRVLLSQTPAPWTKGAWTNPNSGKNAPGPHSPMRRSSSWSGASTTSGTCPDRNGRTWRPPWSSQRLKSRYGSRTAATRRNAARWPQTWWPRPLRPRRWRWKFWCGTTRDSTPLERSCGPRCSPCNRPTITPTPTASLHGHFLHVRGTSENSVTVFIHLLIFAHGKSNKLYFSDKKRRPEEKFNLLSVSR